MKQLCCLLKPAVRCIGCNLPLCESHFIGMECNNKVSKCQARYYYNRWFKDAAGHAFDFVEELNEDRELEASAHSKSNE